MRRLSDEKNLVDFAESLAEAGPADRISAWVYGVVLATFPAIYGFWCISTGTAHFPTRQLLNLHWAQYHGPAALALGVAYASIGFFMHFHYFWSSHQRFSVVGQLGKPTSLLVTAGGIGYFLFQVLVVE